MKKIIIALILSASYFLPNYSYALFNTKQLSDICERAIQNPSPENPQFSFCAGLVLGILSADLVENKLICAPEDLTTKTAILTFIRAAKKTKDQEIEGMITMHKSLVEAYPCKRK